MHCHHPQDTPWQYTPSHQYPDLSKAGGVFDPCHTFVPNQPEPHHNCCCRPCGPGMYECMPKQAPLRHCGHHHHHHHCHAEPEPCYGMPKIVEAVETPCGTTSVVYADGRTDEIANGYIPSGDVENNGPKFMPFDDPIRGNNSNSEGMDRPNFAFNNTDMGATF